MKPVLCRDVFDALLDGLVVWRPEVAADGSLVTFRLIMLNSAAARSYRGDPDSLVGRSFQDTVGGGLDEPLVASLWAVHCSGEPHSLVVEVPEGDWPGGVFESTQVPLPDGLVLSAFRDVSERVRGERMLAAAYEETARVRAIIQTALDSLQEAFALFAVEHPAEGQADPVEPALQAVHVNRSAAELVGAQPDALVGRDLLEVLPYARDCGLWQVVLRSLDDWAPRDHRSCLLDDEGMLVQAWDTTVSRVGQEQVALTWREVTREELALRALSTSRDEALLAATHDALTGLPNRSLVRQRLAEALVACAPDERVGVVFVDLDGFKAVNDTYGHAAGDDVLKATARRLARVVRSGDTAARLSGDEFLLVLTGLPEIWDQSGFVDRARSVVGESVWVEGAVVSPRASFGVVVVGPDLGPADVDAIVARSDEQMYLRKQSGRDRVDVRPAVESLLELADRLAKDAQERPLDDQERRRLEGLLARVSAALG